MARKVIITLLRHDLRIHDHAPLHAAHTAANADVTHLMPLYVFDERHIELSGLPGYVREGPEARTNLCKFWRTGAFRARFLTEGVYDLRDRLRQRNSDLLIRFGKIEQVTANIVKALQNCGDEVKGVYMHKEFYHQEAKQDLAMEHLLLKLGVRVTFFDTVPLTDPRDLPFSIQKIPDVFTPFRKQVEAIGTWGRPPLEMPRVFKPFPKPGPPKAGTTSLSPSYGSKFDGKTAEDLIPFLLAPLKGSYAETPFDASHPRHASSAFPYAGGETSALERLDTYFHQGESPPVARYKETRNQMLGAEYSTKFSPFTCLGMLSPRLVMQSLDEHERKHGASQNTYWVRFELLWRDYFLFISRKYGRKLFTVGGFEEVTDPRQSKIRTAPGWWHPWNADAGKNDKAIRFVEGRTGVPFIDANIMELRETGFMSNRGRQNVASFLTTDLRVDWRVGAEFFESQLIDYEPGANWGNWQYQAGCGNDPRASRQFNPIKQQNDYDPYGDYVRLWLPQLTNVPTNRIMAPWLLSAQEKSQYISGPYPDTPLVEQSNWKPHYTRRVPPRPGQTQAELKAKNPGPRGGQPRDVGEIRGQKSARGSSSRGRGGGNQ